MLTPIGCIMNNGALNDLDTTNLSVISLPGNVDDLDLGVLGVNDLDVSSLPNDLNRARGLSLKNLLVNDLDVGGPINGHVTSSSIIGEEDCIIYMGMP